jgi:hypothetical protein
MPFGQNGSYPKWQNEPSGITATISKISGRPVAELQQCQLEAMI